jgi:hypothetical protein
VASQGSGVIPALVANVVGGGVPGGIDGSLGTGSGAAELDATFDRSFAEEGLELVVPDGVASVPASVESTNPELQLTKAQERQKNQLARQFQRDVTADGASGDPASSTYRTQYLSAQTRNDDLFRVLFGEDKFAAQQRQTNYETGDLLSQ